MAVTPVVATTDSDEIHNLDAVCETLSISKTTVSPTETQQLPNEIRLYENIN